MEQAYREPWFSEGERAMYRSGRREFVQHCTGLAATAALAGRAQAAPSETIGVAVLGAGRGGNLAEWFARLPESRVLAVCETDEARGQALVNHLDQLQAHRPELVVDFRTLLDRSDIDALVVATPDHWHAPAAIHACVAGKDVYVEKPCCHNVQEGRMMVAAARKHDRIVQVGTQLRAAPHYQEAWRRLRDGAIGRVLVAKVINNQLRMPLPHYKDEPIPPGVHYDLWMGPAPARPFNRNRFHYGWHWLWDYGTGDIGNDGVHQVDLARWALGLQAPRAVACSGAKLGWRDGAQETPDTMVVTWEYDDLLVVYEQRDFTPYRLPGHRLDNDNIFFGEEGYMMVDRNGYRVFHARGKFGPAFEKQWQDEGRHYQNFIDCVKSRRREDLIADIEEGHYSAMLCHLGNIAYRTGRRLEFDGQREVFPHDEEASELLGREYRTGYELPRI